jgi:hypothetical protein
MEKVEHAFKTVLDDEKHEFKASSLVPKSIKINTKVGGVSISPKDLKNIKYIITRVILVQFQIIVVLGQF